MKIKISLVITILISMVSLQALASDTREKAYLVQMINQLDALKPLVIAASNEQEKNLRVKFHYTSYREPNGKLHNGLLEDINAMQKGIQEKLNETNNEPHHFEKIKGDYLDSKKVTSTTVGNTAENNHVK